MKPSKGLLAIWGFAFYFYADNRYIGMIQIAEQTGLRGPKFYNAHSPESKPQFGTILKVIRAIEENLRFKPRL